MDLPDSVLFGAVVNIRNTELATLWARFNINLVVNGGLIAVLMTIEQERLGALYVPAHVFGLIVGIIWLLSERFGRMALDHRDSKVREFEEMYFKGDLENYRLLRGTPPRLCLHAKLSLVLIGVFLAAWLLLLTRAICRVGYFS